MSGKRRTKKQKIAAKSKPVNSQFGISFDPKLIKAKYPKKPKNTVQFEDLGSIKKDLFKSLIIASLIIGSILVLYWFS